MGAERVNSRSAISLFFGGGVGVVVWVVFVVVVVVIIVDVVDDAAVGVCLTVFVCLSLCLPGLCLFFVRSFLCSFFVWFLPFCLFLVHCVVLFICFCIFFWCVFVWCVFVCLSVFPVSNYLFLYVHCLRASVLCFCFVSFALCFVFVRRPRLPEV